MKNGFWLWVLFVIIISISLSALLIKFLQSQPQKICKLPSMFCDDLKITWIESNKTLKLVSMKVENCSVRCLFMDEEKTVLVPIIIEGRWVEK